MWLLKQKQSKNININCVGKFSKVFFIKTHIVDVVERSRSKTSKVEPKRIKHEQFLYTS